MLSIITSDALGQGRNVMTSMIRSSVLQGRKTIVIVPDQFSFEYDKMLYKALGAKQFNMLITGGFNRICELIGKKYGGFAGEKTNEDLSVIMMYLAICRLKKEGTALYYKKAFDKGSFINKMIALVKELRSAGITPFALSAAVAQENGSMLSKKLYDISKLYEYYMDELEKRGLKDNSDAVSLAVELSQQHFSFDNADVFIDSFHSFSYDELRLIRVMLSQADNVTVGLMIGSGDNSKSVLTPFAEPVKTRTVIESMAQQLSVKTEYITAPADETVNPSISFIGNNIFSSNHKKLPEHNGVEIVSCCDVYQEAEFVCSEIIRLTREEGLAFGDCAVMLREIDDNRSAINSVFERYEIPFFLDSPELITQYSFVMYFEGLLRCVLGKEYNTENIMRCIKSPLSNILQKHAAIIEDYCTEWNVKGDMWLSPFTAVNSSVENKSAYLEYINNIRVKIITPLEKFKRACEDATAREISEALYQLLRDVELSQRAYSMVCESMKDNDEVLIENARRFRQLWELAVSCISTVFKNIPDEKMSLRRYYELIRTMFANINISAPPEKLDSVMIADPSHSRLACKKAVFVMNCNDGVFPSDVKNEGLISDREKNRLEEMDIKIPKGMISRLSHERLVCYNALTASSDRLYMLWHETNTRGDRLRMSHVLVSVSSMFEKNIQKRADDMPLSFYSPTFRTAFTNYLERCHDRSRETASLKAALECNKDYSERIDYILSSSTKRAFSLDKKHAKDLFYSSTMNLSASRLDTYYKCPFNYFCKYGLKIYPPPSDKTAANNRGSFVHLCLERLLSKKDKNGVKHFDEDFRNITDDQIRERVHGIYEEYLNDQLGGDFGKTKRFEYTAKRWEEAAFYTVQNIRKELENSLFTPVGFEYELKKDDGSSLLTISCEGKYTINIYGTIDRVDIYEHKDEDGKLTKYLRVIDYKTGNIEMKLEKLYNGLELQMLIYLLAVTKNPGAFDSDNEIVMSAALYMPAPYITPDEKCNEYYESGILEEIKRKLEEFRERKFKRFGLVLDSEISLNAMEDIKDRFVNTRLHKRKGDDSGARSGSSIMAKDIREFEAYEQFAYEKILEMADNLYNGNIDAVPLYYSKDRSMCSYCDYKSICRNAYPIVHRSIDKNKDFHDMKEHIEKLMEGGDTDAGKVD